MKIGLSQRKHLPVLKSKNTPQSIFPLWQYSFLKRIEKTGLTLDNVAVKVFEELQIKSKYYLPPFSLEGKTVLDIGSCCGETAYFYLQNGARKVICIEPNPSRVQLLEYNRDSLGMNIHIYAEKFKPSHLNPEVDFIKCDIEGYEIELLPYIGKVPCMLEAHNWWIVEQFEKAGFKIITEPDSMMGLCLMANYETEETNMNVEIATKSDVQQTITASMRNRKPNRIAM